MKPTFATIAIAAALLTLTADPGSASSRKPATQPKVSVYFPAGATELTDAAQAVLDACADKVKETRAPKVIVVGYGDRYANTDTNYRIAASRASTVEAGLVKRGISPDAIVMTAEAGPYTAPGKTKGLEFIAERKTDIIIEPSSFKSF